MKKILIFIALIAISSSCSGDLQDLNENTKRPATTEPQFLFTYGQKVIVDQMNSTSVNLNVFRLFTQQWTETQYPDESQYNITTRTIPDNHWTEFYRDGLANLNESKKIYMGQSTATPEEKAVLENKIAIIDIMMAYSYMILVDTFGNVPYTQALDIKTYPLPAYDDAETIYKDLMAKLTVASDKLTDADSFDSADLMYKGDAMKWRKFANSLRLRMAMNMADKDLGYATAQATAAVSAGVMMSNADNAAIQYLPLQPNTNPLYLDLVASGRTDFVPANTLVDKMNALTDPRRAIFFTEFPAGSGQYKGGVYGTLNNYASYSHPGEILSDPTLRGTLLDYTEVEFLLAEASARGIAVGGDAASHYTAAITASMEDWGVAAEDITAYLAQPSVAYATATGTWQQKIGEQSWIALYNVGSEPWTNYRRLDFPKLSAPPAAYNNLLEVPVRYSYPAAEETINGSNVTAAIAAIGGNTLLTPVFWDIKK